MWAGGGYKQLHPPLSANLFPSYQSSNFLFSTARLFYFMKVLDFAVNSPIVRLPKSFLALFI
jgi:hypothetical protein